MTTNTSSLATKYRPKQFIDIVGQSTTIKSLQTLLAQKEIPKAYLFTGSSGIGKSTICRILAKNVGCEENNIIEYDATIFSGAEDLRNFLETLQYNNIGNNPIKFVIFEEAHSFSKTAWQALLRILENTPKHVYFTFCTTEGNKVPETIKTRCHTFNLREVRSSEIADLLDKICKLETITLPDKSIDLLSREAKGSPRRALTYLSQCRGCTTLEEIKKTIESCEDENYLEELAKLIAFPKTDTWEKILETFKTIKDSDVVINPESIRIQIINYLQACVLNSKNKEQCIEFLDKMSNFLNPINSPTGLANLLNSSLISTLV